MITRTAWLLFLSLLTCAVQAASPADYDRALAGLQAAAQGGNVPAALSAARAVQAVTTLERPGQPPQQVDSSLLVYSVTQAAATKDPKLRATRLEQASQQIASLRAALKTSAPASSTARSPQDTLRAELAGTAYGADAPDTPSTSWLDKLAQRFSRWLEKLFSHKGPTPTAPHINPSFIKGVLLTVAAAAFALLVAVLVQWLRRLPPRTRPLTINEEELTLAEARDADSLRALAEEQAVRGDFRRAFRLIYLATLVALDTGGVLRFDRSRTNWEYLRALRAAGREDVYAAMTPLTRAFDRVWYGFASADAGDYARALAQYDALKSVGPQPAMTADKSALASTASVSGRK